MKKCTKCSEEKPLSEFNKNKRTEDGRNFRCRKCQSAEYLANKERVIERVAAWQAQNKEKTAQYKATWRKANQGYGRFHYLENRDRYAEQAKRWQQENKDKVGIRNNKWKDANPEMVSASRQNRRSMMRGAEGFHTAEDIQEIFNRQGGRCVYCRVELKRVGRGKMHIDHIVPLVKGGSNWPENLQCLCPFCNLSKGALDHFEFERRRGTLAVQAVST
jgi:5-methylcytosine-specific restriction endonuclease McrA